ncbi:inovirus Gp2 family protein [Pseudoalteromonas sp. CO325X]|nr:inovirus Gp2 family protein [Pseudoalteromonas sp. CO325X]
MVNVKKLIVNLFEPKEKELIRHKRFIMSKLSKDYVYQSEDGTPILIRILRNYSIESSRMNKIIKLVDSTICQYQKVFALRFDLHHSKHSTDDSNQILQLFLRKLKQKLIKKYKSIVNVVWSCEKCKSLHHHYHLALLINGNKVNSPAKVFELVRELWAHEAGGVVPYIPHVHYNLIRKSDEAFWITLQALFVRLSYLAKTETDYRPDGGKKFSFGTSHIKFPVQRNSI